MTKATNIHAASNAAIDALIATGKTATKEPKMATTIDISKLTFTELQALAKQAADAALAKRTEEIKVLADAYAKKTGAAGYTVQEAIDALKAYLPVKPASTKKTVKKVRPYIKGVVYKDPDSADTWIGGSNGRPKPWLKKLIEGLSDADATAKLATLAVK